LNVYGRRGNFTAIFLIENGWKLRKLVALESLSAEADDLDNVRRGNRPVAIAAVLS
jgi:hypothetical protein